MVQSSSKELVLLKVTIILSSVGAYTFAHHCVSLPQERPELGNSSLFRDIAKALHMLSILFFVACAKFLVDMVLE